MKVTVSLRRDLQGRILDIGGGGEGVIGRIYGSQVIAIDNRQDELDEAPGGFEKQLMDAAQLSFADNTFDAVTAFFSFMYFPQETLEKAIAEAHRVLKPGGVFCVWDTTIDSANPFIIELNIDADGVPIHTTYGVYLDGKTQTAGSVQTLCKQVGFCLAHSQTGAAFYQRYRKP